jgi:hypothetical protein
MTEPKMTIEPATPGAWEQYLEASRTARVGMKIELDDVLPEHLSGYGPDSSSLDTQRLAS